MRHLVGRLCPLNAEPHSLNLSPENWVLPELLLSGDGLPKRGFSRGLDRGAKPAKDTTDIMMMMMVVMMMMIGSILTNLERFRMSALTILSNCSDLEVRFSTSPPKLHALPGSPKKDAVAARLNTQA